MKGRFANPKIVVLSTLVALVGLVAGCSHDQQAGESSPITSAPLPQRLSGTGDTQFNLIESNDSGIDFVHLSAPSPRHLRTLDNAFAGGGVCVGDYDGDDLPDIYLARPHGSGQLYRNLGGLRFENATEKAGVFDPDTWGTGATFVDIENDGDLDLYVSAYMCPNRLYVNQGDGTFKEKAESYGLAYDGASIMMSFADFDRDGDLDAYLVTNRSEKYEGENINVVTTGDQVSVEEKYRQVADVLVKPDGTIRPIRSGEYDHLYRNNGDQTFSDVSLPAGITGNHMGLSATWWDYNDDRWPDLYVANDFWGPDHLYHNNGDGTFTDVITDLIPHTPWFSMGSAAADINNDGFLDFIGTDMGSTNHYKAKLSMGDMNRDGWFLEFAEPRQYMRNAVYLNTGMNRFQEVAFITGLANTDWTWSPKFADFDNDGRMDVYISNGMTRDWFNSDLRAKSSKLGGPATLEGTGVFVDTPLRREPNMAFRNLGDLKFEEVGDNWGLSHEKVTFGAAVADFDRDGDLDLVINNFDEEAGLYRNQGTSGHRALIRLRGTVSNRYGVGTRIIAEAGGQLHVREMTLAGGFESADEPILHLGLGSHPRIDRLTVCWPSGHVQEFTDLEVDQDYTITEPGGSVAISSATGSPKRAPAAFVERKASQRVRHEERPFNDFLRQPLLPSQSSQLGPGLAVGDIDGDGDEDAYLGGAAGSSGVLLRMEAGSFQPQTQASFSEDQAHEDMGSLFFDADGDGDLDLYVVSGSVECEPGDDVLRDRMYLNDGSGQFKRAAADSLPNSKMSGSVVTASDFDRDGDLDLFVGSRVVPGQYPLSGTSLLLRNEGGRFMDVTAEVAPELGDTGLVTGALWSDATGDGWSDLLVTHDWGPVKLFKNESGRLVDRTTEANLGGDTGWWNGIAASDFDRDGDIDYVVTNTGLNTKYHASADEPTVLYYGDFEGTGEMRLIEAKPEHDEWYPIRGKSCSQNAMPGIRQRFPKYHDFAVASLQDIYTEKCLEEAHRFEATTLESTVFLNDGKGVFTAKPLPRMAQVAPGFGVVATEIDGDGYPDLYLAQNFFGPQRETGRMDGGVSLLLKGNGDGTFTPRTPLESGLLVPGDGRSVSVTDLDEDGRPDLMIAVNDSDLRIFENRSAPATQYVTVELRGFSGNLHSIGARVTVHRSDGAAQTSEVYCGSGYLSQSTPKLVFGLGKSGTAVKASIVWPNGETSTHPFKKGESKLKIQQPAQ